MQLLRYIAALVIVGAAAFALSASDALSSIPSPVIADPDQSLLEQWRVPLPEESTRAEPAPRRARFGAPFALDLLVLPPPDDSGRQVSLTLRSTFKDVGYTFLSEERVGQDRFLVSTGAGFRPAPWQSHGAELHIPGEHYLFDHEVYGREDDAIVFRLDEDLGWLWIDGSGEYSDGSEKVALPSHAPPDVEFDELLDMAQSPHWSLRARGAWGLGELADSRARESLESLLFDPVWYVQRFAIQSLAELRDPTDLDKLLPFLTSRDTELRRTAARALCEYADVRCTEPGSLARPVLDESARERIRAALRTAVREDEDRGTLEEAARTLEAIAPGDAIEILSEQMGDGKSESEERALVVLATLGGAAAEPVATALLDSPRYVYTGLEALYLLDCATCRTKVRDMVTSGQTAAARRLAMTWSRGLTDEERREMLYGLLVDENARLRGEAARLLNATSWVPTDDAQKTRYYFAAGYWNKLATVAELDIEVICRGLDDDDDDVQNEALELLGQRVGPEVGQCLSDHIRGKSRRIARESLAEMIRGLGHARWPDAIELIETYLDDRRPEVEAAAMVALAELGATGHTASFIDDLDHRSAAVRKAAATALDTLDARPDDIDDKRWRFASQSWDQFDPSKPEDLEFLLDHGMTDRDSSIRAATVEVLGRRDTPRTRTALRAALFDRSPQVSDAASQALGGFAEPVVAELAEVLDEAKDKRMVIRALGFTRSTAAHDVLVPYLSAADWQLRQAAASALDMAGYRPTEIEARADFALGSRDWIALASLGEPGWRRIDDILSESSAAHRIVMLSALGAVKSQRSVDALLPFLGHDNVLFSIAARSSIATLGPVATDALRGLLDTEERRLLAIELLGQIRDRRAVPDLIQLLEPPTTLQTAEREALVVALGQLRDRRALDVLVATLEDADESVRLAAKRALRRLDWYPSTSEEARRFAEIREPERTPPPVPRYLQSLEKERMIY